MNGISIDVEGYQKSAETSSDNQESESPLLQKMKRAYDDFFRENYESKLPKGKNNEVIFPQFTVIVDEEEYEIVFDYDFFEQLCDMYIIEGWEGVVKIESKIGQIIEAIKKVDPVKLNWAKDIKWEKDVSPKDVSSWNLGWAFFNFMLKILALLIRETLANIERFSAIQIIAKLSITNIEAAKAFDKYKIKTEEKVTKSDSLTQGHDVTEKTITYKIGEPALAKELFDLLTAAVNEKYLFDLSVKKLRFLPQAIKEARARSAEPNSFTSDPSFRNAQRVRAEEMEKELPKYKSLKEASEALLKVVVNLIKTEHPLGLLIYGTLKKGFKKEEMENQFGLIIDNLRKDLESLGTKIDSQVSQVELFLPFKQTDDIRQDISNFTIPDGGIEKFVSENWLAKYQDSEFFPLIAEENINQLFDKEIIQTDSFENVVGFHYLSALIKRIGEIEQDEKKVEDFWKTISKISSALSLAALVTPVTAEFAPLLRGGAAIADLAMLAYTINSVTGSLKKTNELVKKALVNQDDFTTEVFAQLGEVISLRKQFYDSINEQIATEIFNIFIGGKLPVFKEFLLARSYYYDFETLTDIDLDGEETE